MKKNKKTKKLFLILFGLSATGKSVVGEFLRDNHGFFYCDGDSYYTEVQKENHRKGIPTTDEQRDEQFKILIRVIQKLKKEHEKLVVTSWLPQRYQKSFYQEFSDAFFILITSPFEHIEQRLTLRKNHYVNKEYALYVSKQWGKPIISHKELRNDSDLESLKERMENLLQNL